MFIDATRKLCASVYTNTFFRDTIIEFAKNPYKAIVDSPAIDTRLLLTHALNSQQKDRNRNFILAIPSLLFWILLTSAINSEYPDQAIIIILILLTLMCIIVFTWSMSDKKFMKDSFRPSNFNTTYTDDRFKTLTDELKNKTCQNVTYYSGYSPFIGHGRDIGGWSFVVDIDKGKEILGNQIDPDTFNEKELYDRLTEELQQLRIDNLTISDKVFFNGKRIRSNKELLPKILGYPNIEIDRDLLEKAVFNKIAEARYYKVIQIIDWEGDLILTAFVRFQKDNRTLFVETNYFLLPPIIESFKEIDRSNEISGTIATFFTLLSTPFLAITHSIIAIFKVLGYIPKAINDWLKEYLQIKAIKNNIDYDYGSATTIREAVAQYHYEQFFQKLDKERLLKTVEKRIFNAINDFLDDKGIDTSEFRERETRILNNGVIVNGGNINADNMAVGKDAKIKSKSKPDKKLTA